MAGIFPPSDRRAIEGQVFASAEELLREIGSAELIPSVSGQASLERDLGLGSIERIELASRLDRALGTSLLESAVAEAETLDDIVTLIAGPAKGKGAGDRKREEAEAREPANPDAGEAAQTRKGGSRGRLLRTIWEKIYGVYAAGMFFAWLVPTWLIVLAMPAGRAAARLTTVALRFYFATIGCRIQVEGRGHMYGHGAAIYVSYHTSYSDVLAVMAVLDTPYHFIAKNEINDMPFIGTFLRKLGHFSFERGKLRARSQQAEQMEKALVRGESVFVFAEGTFGAEPGVRPFQLGAFRAAVKTGRPIIPVALQGTRRFLRDGTFLPRPSRIRVTFSPALFPHTDEPGREWAEVLRLREETRVTIATHAREPMLHTPATWHRADSPVR